MRGIARANDPQSCSAPKDELALAACVLTNRDEHMLSRRWL